MKTVAQSILDSGLDRTLKERRDMCEIRMEGFSWSGDIVQYEFEDGSSIFVLLDDNLAPLEMVY